MAEVKLLREGMSLVDSGPLYATIMVSREKCPLSEAAIEGGQYALEILEQLATFLPIIKRKSLTLKSEDKRYPEVVKEMISASQAVNDRDFTPMSAVAGATADMVADYLLKTGATKIVVNNGGDISIRLAEGEKVKVGLRLSLADAQPRYSITVEKDCGVCTSGFGGRSFTLGIADAVTVLATRASLADAASTYIGNKTSINSLNIEREYAEKIYLDTDIPGEKVTTFVGVLTDDEVQEALENGKKAAYELINKGVIQGAFIAVKGKMLPLGFFAGRVEPV